MTSWLPLLHASLAALWLGCVLTEALFERALLAGGPELHPLLANLHRRVDFLVELPALGGVVLTGLLMLRTNIDALLVWKIAFGIAAVSLNLWCVALVLRRRTQAEAGDTVGFARTDHAQHLWGAGVLLMLLLAFALALLRRAGWA